MILAFDIGGTKILSALIEGSEIVERRETRSTVFSDLQGLAPLLQETAGDMATHADRVAVATTGLVSTDSVHFWSAGPRAKLNLRAEVESVFSLPVTVLNDGWAAAWGEYCTSMVSPDETIVYVTASTGIGGGIVANRQLITSATGIAGHLGHVAIPNAHDRYSSYGRLNCVESISSGRAIAQHASSAIGEQISTERAIELAKSDERCRAVVDEAAAGLASLFGNLTAIFDQSRTVLGGSVGLNSDFRQRVSDANAQLPEQLRTRIVRPSHLKNAELIGAALYASESAG